MPPIILLHNFRFPLGVGATAEIPFTIPYHQYQQPHPPSHGRSSSKNGNRSIESFSSSDSATSASNMITVLARGKRDSVQRSFVFGDPVGENHVIF